MNNSFLLVALTVVAVGLGLLLLLGSAESAPAEGVAEATVGAEETVAETTSTQYWEPVQATVSTTEASRISYVPPSTSWGPCGSVPPATTVTVESVRIAGGCGSPVSPCTRPGYSVCPRVETTRTYTPSAPASTSQGLVGGCGRPVSPCADPACAWPASVCRDPCERAERERPGINRNVPVCIDECGFVQLHSTAHQPVCSAVRFEWAASNGRFLNPNVSDPLYFAPAVYSPYGEDVWITLVITDEAGVRYTDQIRLHVRNSR